MRQSDQPDEKDITRLIRADKRWGLSRVRHHDFFQCFYTPRSKNFMTPAGFEIDRQSLLCVAFKIEKY